MRKPFGYDQAQTLGEFKALPAGGYVCIIKQVQETKSKSGNDMVVVSFDIYEGDYKGYYEQMYRRDTRQDKKWRGVARQVTTGADGTTSAGFKTFCTSVEKSNPGFVISWGDGPAWSDQFKNRLVGGIFQREEYQKQDGGSGWSTRLDMFRSVDSIRSGDFTVPEDKPLEAQKGYAAPKPRYEQADLSGFMNIPDGVEDAGLPFN